MLAHTYHTQSGSLNINHTLSWSPGHALTITHYALPTTTIIQRLRDFSYGAVMHFDCWYGSQCRIHVQCEWKKDLRRVLMGYFCSWDSSALFSVTRYELVSVSCCNIQCLIWGGARGSALRKLWRALRQLECVCSGGFRHGRTGQSPGAAYLWGAANHMGGATSSIKKNALRSGYQWSTT